MRKLSLGRLLHLIVIVPLLVVVVFGGVLIVDSLRAYLEIERIADIERLVAAASRLMIRTMNQEADASLAFVASGLERERLELVVARQRVDVAIAALKHAAATSGVSDSKGLMI